MNCRPTRARHTIAPLLIALWIAPATEAQIPKTVKSPYVAPADQALLVFSRPRRRQASETAYRIVTQAGRCAAVLYNGRQTASPMWPGKHMLMVITGTAPPTIQLMQANLSAGKTYVVNLRSRVNMKSPVEIEVVRRSAQPLESEPAPMHRMGLVEALENRAEGGAGQVEVGRGWRRAPRCAYRTAQRRVDGPRGARALSYGASSSSTSARSQRLRARRKLRGLV
jgi:hypothetical protein